MSETFRLNRIFQFAYPIFVLFTVLFAWNSVGQVHGQGDPRSPGFDSIDLRRTPDDSQKTCTVPKQMNFEGSFCAQEASPAEKLLGIFSR